MLRKNIEVKVLVELLTNSRRSDREIAKALGISQPTTTRRRVGLEEEKIVQRYIAVPDLAKAGFTIVAITVGSLSRNRTLYKNDMQRFEKNVIFMANGKGLNGNLILISVHRDYASLVSFCSGLAVSGIDSQSFLIDPATQILKPFNMDLDIPMPTVQK